MGFHKPLIAGPISTRVPSARDRVNSRHYRKIEDVSGKHRKVLVFSHNIIILPGSFHTWCFTGLNIEDVSHNWMADF